MSWKVTPQFAVGVGVNYQQIKATLTQNVNYSGALLTGGRRRGHRARIRRRSTPSRRLTPGLDSKATITGDDWAWGWNIGVAWDATPQLRLGASYRSEIKYNVSGNINFENPTVTLPPGTPPQLAGTIAALSAGVNSQALYGRGVTSDITIPQIANLSMLYRINPQWDVMADAQYTGWSSIPELRVQRELAARVAGGPAELGRHVEDRGRRRRTRSATSGRRGSASRSTRRRSRTTRRCGCRTPTAGGSPIGTEYKWTPNWKFDAGFVYIFADSPSFNQNQGSTARNALVNGTYDASMWILSMQATYTF